ncbi:MAG TPA: DUF4233 domain-containing protein [Microbacteriaceae bacterium]|nr:DUF4233 domain-containing protein [Microbacteriaceae bacterium]
MTEALKRNLLTPKLVAIVLGLDVFLVIFVAFAAFGLRWLEPGAAFGIGGALIVLCLLGAGLVRRRATLAVGIGWLVQAVLVAGGIALLFRDPAGGVTLLLVAGGSLALWVWCLWRGAKTDRAPAPYTLSGDAA